MYDVLKTINSVTVWMILNFNSIDLPYQFTKIVASNSSDIGEFKN